MGRFQYFGYGSNMLTAKLKRKDRCPSADKIDVCRTNKYTLKFHKESTKDGSGKGDMAFTGSETDEVYGVAFSIDESEASKLDSAEGYSQYGIGYAKKEIDVVTSSGTTLRVLIYYASKKAINPNLKPYHWYKGQTVDGAKEHGLPEDYIKKIEAFESISDDNPEREHEETEYKRKSSSNSI